MHKLKIFITLILSILIKVNINAADVIGNPETET
jgi:hypothetical protein